MAVVARPNTYTDGAVTSAAEANSNETTLYNLVNGSLDKDNLSASANIANTQLAQITTASKVSGAAITSLSSIPSGAGVIPVANLGSGSPTAATVLLGDGSWSSTPTFTGSLTAGTPCVKSPIALSSKTTTAHGLGAIPGMVNAYIECLSTDKNYAAGDRLPMQYYYDAANIGMHYSMDATNVNILISSGSVNILDANSPVGFAALDVSKWKAVVVPYKVN
jgi:hypothetical protein